MQAVSKSGAADVIKIPDLNLFEYMLRAAIKVHRRRKRGYFLLEVLLSMAIVALCLLPLLRLEWAVLQGEKDEQKKFRLEKAIRSHATLVLEDFYMKKRTYSQIGEKGSTETISLPSGQAVTLALNFRNEKEGQAPVGLLDLTYTLPTKEWKYTFFYKKII